MPKIIHLIPVDGIGGVETAARTMLQGNQLLKNFKIMFIAGQTLAANKHAVVESPFSSPNNPFAHLLSLKKILAEKPEILICSLWKSVPVGVMTKILRPKTKLVCFLHLAKEQHLFDKIFHAVIFRFCDAVWADSQATLDARFKKRPNVIVRIISFVTQKKSKSAIHNKLQPRFVFWGRIHRQKGLDRSVILLQKLIESGCEGLYEIWGPDDGEKSNIMKLIKELGIEKFVAFKGVMSSEQLTEISNSNSFYLQLSRTEGMAMSVVEAMQSGLVPIVTPVGEIEKYCVNNSNAIIVADLNDFDTVISSIHSLLNNEKKYREMQTCSQKTWLESPLYIDDFLLAGEELFMEKKADV